MLRRFHLLVPWFGGLAANLAAQTAAAEPTPAPTMLQTVPEATAFQHTSRFADVVQFLDGLKALPHGDRISVRAAGKSHEGRDILVVRVELAEPPADALRVLVTGNIHAGEVEGKEALLVLLREFANGEHEAVLQHAVLHFVPVYNADGNERIDVRNRAEQNGPDGVGQRENGMGLDLNRDCIKAEAPETQALLRLFAEIDPHLYMDLHTTNGSYHGYHLTYSPSLCTNVAPGIAALSRQLLDDATAAIDRQHHYQVFDYGNFETHGVNDVGAGQATPGVEGWWTYDHRPRYVTNYFGLRNRIAVLSEAYSYCDFETRIAVTRAFVLGVVEALLARREQVLAACALADRQVSAPDAPVYFGFDTGYGDAEQLPVLVGEVEDGGRGHRHVRKDVQRPKTMAVYRSFRSRRQIALPDAWAVLAPSDEVVARLKLHGIQYEVLTAPVTRSAQQFAVADKRKPKRPYQGHQELQLQGSWGEMAPRALPAGTLLVKARQRLGRLAAQLLEPESEDSLSRWNFFEATTAASYPVLRVGAN